MGLLRRPMEFGSPPVEVCVGAALRCMRIGLHRLPSLKLSEQAFGIGQPLGPRDPALGVAHRTMLPPP